MCPLICTGNKSVDLILLICATLLQLEPPRLTEMHRHWSLHRQGCGKSSFSGGRAFSWTKTLLGLKRDLILLVSILRSQLKEELEWMIRPHHTISQTSPTEHFPLTLWADFLGCLKVNWEAEPSALRNQLPVWIGDSSAHNCWSSFYSEPNVPAVSLLWVWTTRAAVFSFVLVSLVYFV